MNRLARGYGALNFCLVLRVAVHNNGYWIQLGAIWNFENFKGMMANHVP